MDENQKIRHISHRHLTSDEKYDGDKTYVFSTSAVKGVFSAVYFIEDTVFDVGVGGTVQTDADVSSLTGEVFPKGGILYGRWTRIKLVSGAVYLYSPKDRAS